MAPLLLWHTPVRCSTVCLLLLLPPTSVAVTTSKCIECIVSGTDVIYSPFADLPYTTTGFSYQENKTTSQSTDGIRWRYWCHWGEGNTWEMKDKTLLGINDAKIGISLRKERNGRSGNDDNMKEDEYEGRTRGSGNRFWCRRKFRPDDLKSGAHMPSEMDQKPCRSCALAIKLFSHIQNFWHRA